MDNQIAPCHDCQVPPNIAQLGFSTRPLGHNKILLLADGHGVCVGSAAEIRAILGISDTPRPIDLML